jgi:hypothetical protein
MIELRRVQSEAVVPLSEIIAANGQLPNGWAGSTEPAGIECDLDLVKQLAQKSATFLPPEQMDPWLAPRLHAALRIPRRLATDEGMWAWLAFHCQPFVDARFRKGKEKLHPWRYRGTWSRNALSRLWWGAEMTRNGPDYSSVPLCFARTRTAQFALELMYSWDRAAAIAFTRVAEGVDGGVRLSDDRTNALSTRLKVLLTLRSLDSFGTADADDTEEFDAEWASHRPSFASLVRDDLSAIQGPSTGTVSQSRIDELAAWFRQVAESGLDADLEPAESSV